MSTPYPALPASSVRQAGRAGLLLIDIQEGFSDPAHWGSGRSTPAFEANVARLLAAFREAGAPVFHVCHHSLFETSPLHPSRPGAGFMACAAPAPPEPVFPKTVNSPFVETRLRDAIREAAVQRLFICGLMTAHCVSSTVRMAANLSVVPHAYGTPYVEQDMRGRLVLVQDATATFGVAFAGKDYDAETVHAIHLASMRDEFCDLDTTDNVLQQL